MTARNNKHQQSLRRHLRSEEAQFALPRKGAPSWRDGDVHRAAFQADGQLYALLALDAGIQAPQRTRMLLQLLRGSRAGLETAAVKVIERATRFLAAVLPPDEVLTVFLALRRERRNSRRISRFVLRYLLCHPLLPDLAFYRRAMVVDCLEHAMGRNAARACAKQIAARQTEGPYLRRHLLRFADNADRVVQVFGALYGHGKLPARGNQRYTTAHEACAAKTEATRRRPKTITATNRGDIAATLVHIYRGGSNPQLTRGLEDFVVARASTLPVFEGTLAIVLDVSASTRGYGEREFCNVSQSVALSMVLQRCCSAHRLIQVGGSGSPPRPEGHTDLATAVIEALETEPDVVAVISDGYENTSAGDLASVVASLPEVGVDVPVLFLHSMFTDKDALDLRRPAPSLPEVCFWHEDDFEKVMVELCGATSAATARRFLRDRLLASLAKWETEVNAWTATI